MQLNEILDENTVLAISKKTNISENNIDAMIAADFDKIKRVKTMGFISILEREYNVDLSAFKEQALEYYSKQNNDESITLGMPIVEEKREKSKFFIFFVFLLIVFAIWYAFTNLDKEKLNAMLPFSEETLSEMIMPGKQSDIENKKNIEKNVEEDIAVKELSIENITTSNSMHTDKTTVKPTVINEKNSSY